MKPLPEEVYQSNFRKYYAEAFITSNTIYSTRLIAIKDENLFPVNIKVGPQFGFSFIINNNICQLTRDFYSGIQIKGYKIYDFQKTNINDLITREKELLTAYKQSASNKEKLVNALTSMKTNYPELFI
ncbi:MAG: hypothetical protein PVF17_01505 [Ignavibacteria bacterium]|jgi:hypothetical protein